MGSEYHHRRGRNWFTAIGVLFSVMAGIVLIQQMLIWGPEFALDFLINSEFTNEKVSVAMLGFGIFMIVIGLRRHGQPR